MVEMVVVRSGSGCMAGGWGEWMVGLWWMFGGAGVAGCWVYDGWLVGVGWSMRCYGAVICLYVGGVVVVRVTAVPRAV